MDIFLGNFSPRESWRIAYSEIAAAFYSLDPLKSFKRLIYNFLNANLGFMLLEFQKWKEGGKKGGREEDKGRAEGDSFRSPTSCEE